MSDRVLVFDMDGVLVDVTESYREGVQQTVEHFTGKRVTREVIQEYKNAGGWNNDWRLSHHLIAGLGVDVPYEAVVEEFNRIFLGNGRDGLIFRERWVAQPGLLERLARTWRFSVFTGRVLRELEVTLERFARHLTFDPIITADDAPAKPSPDGLLQIARICGAGELWYVGDTVDDARCARAAGVPFIGIAAPSSAGRAELIELFKAESALAILDDINFLESALPQ